MIRHLLSNGLRVLVEPISTCRSVSFGIWVKTGSRNEPQELNGISHFIEHMLFKGTDRYSAKDIAEIFDGLGGYVNAFTTKEYTCYYIKVLDEHLPIAIEVLADMFFHSNLDKDELDKERNVIMEEISMYDDTPEDLVHELMARASYGNHSLGSTILGTEMNLSAMGTEDLRKYMKENYHLQNTIISIAGNVNENVFDLLEKHFSSFANHGLSSDIIVPQFTSGIVYQFKQTEQNHICLSMPGDSLHNEDLYAMILLNNVVGGGMSSRLFQEIREKRGLAYSVYSYHTAYADSGLFTIYTGTAPKQTGEVLQVTLELIAEFIANGIKESELHKGKEQLKGSLILSLESTSARMNRMGKNELMIGKHYTLDETIARIEAVQMEQVNHLINRVFKNSFALAMVGQSDEPIQNLRRDTLVV